MIARGLKALRDKAERIGGRQTFYRLRGREGLGPDILNKTRVSRLLAILEDLPEVEEWRETLTPKRCFDWASPEAVYAHCPVFTEPKPKSEELTAVQKLKQTVAQLEEENHKLKQDASRGDTDSWHRSDRVSNIARVMFEKLGRNKAPPTPSSPCAIRRTRR